MKFLSALFSLFFICALLIGGVTYYGYKKMHASGPLNEQKEVIIPNGASVSSIAQILEKEGVISSPVLFKMAAHIKDKNHSLKAGEYLFNAGISINYVIKLLSEGKVIQRSFMIPEGLTSYEVAALLNNTPYLEGDVFKIPKEGSLLPETYHYTRGEQRSAKISRMKQALKDVLDEAWENRVDDLPLKSKEEALILASIIEKETSKNDEYRKVAGVFINRLRKGMLLQTDPTVIYAIHKGKPQNEGRGPIGRRLLRSDLQMDSPYNTYKNAGLPPGPICNPGRQAIEAALNPEQHNYIFFVADGTGGHAFAKTLAEHNQNVAKWRQVRDAQ